MMTVWWDDYFKDVDSFDINRLSSWFDENVELRFANWPECRGREAVLGAFADFWTHLKGLSHSTYGVLEEGSRVCTEANVTFVRADGREVIARAATVFDRPEDKIKAIYVYVDVTPVFAS